MICRRATYFTDLEIIEHYPKGGGGAEIASLRKLKTM